MILHGDCIEKMKELEDNSVDAIVTDPPYGLSFMGKKWDYDVPSIEVWKEALRVLKHGGFLLSFAGTRTYHRMVVNIEDAGFEIRDMILWLYGSGFPKSLNIGKQIDKIQGNEREVTGEKIRGDVQKAKEKGAGYLSDPANRNNVKQFGYGKETLTKGNSEWEGWGTALKPACEPIVVARKPLSEKNVALNVLKHGTGGINIDECRIGNGTGIVRERKAGSEFGQDSNWNDHKNVDTVYDGTQGRFPANIILDEEAGKMLDEQSGELKSGSKSGNYKGFDESNVFGDGKIIEHIYTKSVGGASRFFYCAKASKSERNLGCEELQDKQGGMRSETSGQHITRRDGGDPKTVKNNHPTVKPIKLMEYLVKLVSREGANVLDPFLGSGTTAIACVKLNRKFIGIEKEEEYIKIAEARLKPFTEQKQLNYALEQSNEGGKDEN